MDMDIQNNSFLSIDQLANQYLNSSQDRKKQHRKIWYLSGDPTEQKPGTECFRNAGSEILQACRRTAGKQRH